MGERARVKKDWATSDKIRDQLRERGVELWDKNKIWRRKSGHAGIIVGYLSEGPSDNEIATLVVQREKARQASDYRTSDIIREELKKYGVEIYDKDKVWKSRNGKHGKVPTFDEVQAGIGMAGAAVGPKGKGGMGSLMQQNAILLTLLANGGVGGGAKGKLQGQNAMLRMMLGIQ